MFNQYDNYHKCQRHQYTEKDFKIQRIKSIALKKKKRIRNQKIKSYVGTFKRYQFKALFLLLLTITLASCSTKRTCDQKCKEKREIEKLYQLMNRGFKR